MNFVETTQIDPPADDLELTIVSKDGWHEYVSYYVQFSNLGMAFNGTKNISIDGSSCAVVNHSAHSTAQRGGINALLPHDNPRDVG
jgi:hypothetical protein